MENVLYFLVSQVDVDCLESGVQLISINCASSIDIKQVEDLLEGYRPCTCIVFMKGGELQIYTKLHTYQHTTVHTHQDYRIIVAASVEINALISEEDSPSTCLVVRPCSSFS